MAPFTVWLSPTGSDANNGSQSSPVLTLARAQDIVRAAAPATDVEIRIAQGTYTTTGQTTWDHYIPGHAISFMPADYQVGMSIGDFAGRPVFRSNGHTGYWLVAKIPVVYAGPDLVAGLRFYYLQIERYGQGGLMLYGRTSTVDGYRTPTTGLDGSKVWGMKFHELGSIWGPELGYGGLSLVNSSDNDVGNNHFRYLENAAPSAAGIHGVYAQHGASRNVIRSNSFYRITGHPMRVRNRSNGNDIYGNTFALTGSVGYWSGFVTLSVRLKTSGSPLECASQGNVFHNNDLVSAYAGGYLGPWYLPATGRNQSWSGRVPAAGLAASHYLRQRMITRSQVLTRASTIWIPGTVPYSQSTLHQPDGYRQDCSGYVSMCWAIPPGLGWGGESTVSLVTREWMVEIPRAELLPGDAIGLCGPGTAGDDGHIQLIEAYDPATGRASIWEQAVAVGAVPCSGTFRAIDPSYRAYRYRGITDEGDDMYPVIVHCTDGTIWRSHANVRQRITEKQRSDIAFWYPRAGYTPPITVTDAGQVVRFAPADMDIWGVDIATLQDGGSGDGLTYNETVEAAREGAELAEDS